MKSIRAAVLSTLLSLTPVAPALAQGDAPPPPGFTEIEKSWQAQITKLSKSGTARQAANKRLVLGFLHGLVLAAAGRVSIEDVGDKYLAKDYIQHDPNVPTGRDGFVRWFKAGGMNPDTPGAPKVDVRQIGIPHMVVAIAEGDYVATVSQHLFPDPTSPGQRFTWSHLAMFRVEGDKLVEHWNEGFKGAYWCRLNYCDPARQGAADPGP